MPVREWSGVTVGVVWLVWLVAVTLLFWWPTFWLLRQARASGDTVFLVAHLEAWLLYAILAIAPPLLLTLHWYRNKGT